MLLAVLSDIHGNLEALQRVLEDMESCAVDEVVCLGDVIGYGPEPEACVQIVRDRNIPTVLGNHEKGVTQRAGRDWFNPVVRETLGKTEAMLSEESIDWIRSLPRFRVEHGHYLVHGFPPQSVTTYLFEKENEEVAAILDVMSQEICFIGHTHELALVSRTPSDMQRGEIEPGERILPPGPRYMVNAGSIGQPRDSDNRAKYVLWDNEARRLTVRAVEYDVEATAKAILALGFPEQYARRLR